jgi:hypothetical protein
VPQTHGTHYVHAISSARQRYTPAVPPSTPASHKHLHHWVFLIDEAINDYEEDNAHYGDASIGRIHANLKASDIGLEDTPSKFTKIIPHVMYATPSTHSLPPPPTCTTNSLTHSLGLTKTWASCKAAILYQRAAPYTPHHLLQESDRASAVISAPLQIRIPLFCTLFPPFFPKIKGRSPLLTVALTPAPLDLAASQDAPLPRPIVHPRRVLERRHW